MSYFLPIVTLIGFIIPLCILFPPTRPKERDGLLLTHERAKETVVKDGNVVVIGRKRFEFVQATAAFPAPMNQPALVMDSVISESPSYLPDEDSESEEVSYQPITEDYPSQQITRLAIQLFEPKTDKQKKLQYDAPFDIKTDYMVVTFPWSHSRWSTIWSRLTLTSPSAIDVIIPLTGSIEPISTYGNTKINDLSRHLPRELEYYIGTSNKLSLVKLSQ